MAQICPFLFLNPVKLLIVKFPQVSGLRGDVKKIGSEFKSVHHVVRSLVTHPSPHLQYVTLCILFEYSDAYLLLIHGQKLKLK